MATDLKEIQLTDDQRNLLARRADETGRPWSELLQEIFSKIQSPRETNAKERSLYDALSERGLIGFIKDEPGDLSTNPKHMEGFGKNGE